MPGYEERASILEGLGGLIFTMVCERSTPGQWAEWLRVPLEHAAGTANADLVEKLLKAGGVVSAGWEGCDGQTLLHAAAKGGNEEVVSAFLEAGAKEDINMKDRANGHTPLHLAALGGKVAAAKALMMTGADVNIRDADNEGPLHLAIRGGHAGIAERLLLSGADPDLEGSDGDLPIHITAILGQEEVVRNLLHRGVDVNRLNDEGSTPLYLAAQKNRLSTVELLLCRGADPAILCDGHPPLYMAAVSDNPDMVAALVEAGADIEAMSRLGLTPLHSSVWGEGCAATLALLQLGANVHATIPERGSTPLHMACQQGNLDGAKLLLSWGADENALDNDGHSPSARIQNIADVAERVRPKLERLSKLLASAPQDRAWRRRGMMVMCRAHPDRLRLAVEVPDTAEAIGQPQGRPSRRARRGEVDVEVTIGGAEIDGADVAGGSVGRGRRAAREGTGGGGGGGFDGVAAWLVGLREEDMFRQIVGFL